MNWLSKIGGRLWSSEPPKVEVNLPHKGDLLSACVQNPRDRTFGMIESNCLNNAHAWDSRGPMDYFVAYQCTAASDHYDVQLFEQQGRRHEARSR